MISTLLPTLPTIAKVRLTKAETAYLDGLLATGKFDVSIMADLARSKTLTQPAVRVIRALVLNNKLDWDEKADEYASTLVFNQETQAVIGFACSNLSRAFIHKPWHDQFSAAKAPVWWESSLASRIPLHDYPKLKGRDFANVVAVHHNHWVECDISQVTF